MGGINMPTVGTVRSITAPDTAMRSVLPNSRSMCRTSDGHLHATWLEYEGGTIRDYLQYAKSTDGGVSWGSPTTLRDLAGASYHMVGPSICCDSNDNLYLICSITDGTTSTTISDLTLFINDGTWDSGTVIRDGSALSGNCGHSTICCDSNDKLWIIYIRTVTGTYTIFATGSSDSGSTWDTDEQVNGGSAAAKGPTCTVDTSNVLHAAWMEVVSGKYKPHYSSRTASPWATPIVLDTDSAFHKDYPSIVVDSGGDIWVAYHGARSGDSAMQIYYVVYTTSWSSPSILSDDSSDGSTHAGMSVDNSGHVYVAWQQHGPDDDIVMREWNGSSWESEAIINNGTSNFGEWRVSCLYALYPSSARVESGAAFIYGCEGALKIESYLTSGIEWEPVTDTAILKDEALQLFATRTIANANRLENPLATVISYIRFFDSNGDYIELPVARNTSLAPAGGNARDLIFDETGGTEADPEYTSWTQDYRDLKLLVYVPRFTKTYDISGYVWGYSTDPFTITDYKLYNEGGTVVAEAADSTIGFSIVQGTRYLLRFTIRLFNDVVEQDYGENTRCIVVQSGLSTIARRLLHEGSPQEYSRPPMFMGVGGTGAYHIANGGDGKWMYDAGPGTYTNITTVLFPSSTAEGDAMAFCREGTPPDWIEGIYFNISAAGTLDDDVSLVWEYFDDDDNWVTLKGVVDGTSNFTTDGHVRWSIPTDIQTDAEEKSGTVGSYYRVRLVGGSWASDPERPTVAAATSIQPLVMKTVSSETDLQLPYTRKSADLIATPFTGTAAKVSASFGLGGIPEEYDSDGYMIAHGYEPLREVALFTTPGVEQEEALTLGSYTGAVAGEVATIPDTNPYPLKIVTVRNTTTGEIYPVNERVVYDIVNHTGGNYLTPIPGVPAVTVEISYIGYTITPTITPQNILSVSGNTQTLFGPSEVVRYSSHLFPGDSNAGGDVMLTPRYIRLNGISVERGGTSFDPNLAENVTAAGRTADPEAFDSVGEFDDYYKKDGYWIGKYMAKAFGGNDHAPNADQYWSAGWPLILMTFDMSEYKDMENTMLHISAMGTSGDEVSLGVFIWAAGDPSSNNLRGRVTGWKKLTQSRNIRNNLDLQALITSPVDFKWKEQGDGTKESPIIDESNRMHLLIAPIKKTLKDGKKRVKMPAYAAWGDAGPLEPYQKRETRKKLMEELGVITLNYAGLTGSPVNKTNEMYKFRRGIDWRYVLGDSEGYWVQTTNTPENHARKLRDGTEYVPTTPTHKVTEEVEEYFFGTHPDDVDWVDDGKTGSLYVQGKPVGGSGVYGWEEGGEKSVDTISGTEGSGTPGIAVNFVAWDSDAIWNDQDQDYEWDHKQSGSGGDGAGLINVTFKAKDWSNTQPRKVGMRYLAQEDPELTITYLKESPVMFARAHFSPYSFGTIVRPDYGDKLRVYFEIQFGHKRSA